MYHTINAKTHHIACSGKLLVIFLLLLFLIASPFAPVAEATSADVVMLTVNQRLLSDGKSAVPTETFTYLFHAKTAAAPMPDGSDAEGFTFTMDGTTSVAIGPIRFLTAGIYVYELRCTTADMSGYTIDRQVYTIEIHVSDKLTSTVLIYDASGVKVSEIRFTHIYGTLASDPAIMVDPPVKKIVEGKPRTASTFTFTLTAENRSNPMPAGSVNGVKHLTIIGAGEGEFGTWSYTEAGTYRYTVSEVNGGVAGYSYDRTVYTITDRVTAVDGQLLVTRRVTNDAGEQAASLTFVNIYEEASPGTSRPQAPDGAPETGDFSNPLLWTLLLFSSGTLLLVLIFLGYRTRKSSKKGGDRCES